MATIPTVPTLSADTCIVRDTAAKPGRTRAIEPSRTPAARFLHYGRIILSADDRPVRVPAGELETGLICLAGEAAVHVGSGVFTLVPYDALYVPRETSFEVRPGVKGCDLAEIAAPVDNQYPLQFVSFADVQKDPGLHFSAGGDASRRDLNILLGKNIQAGRLMAGVTFSQPGNWTSWPPHEHAVLAEEAYLYIAMPKPAFGIQLVYANDRQPEVATIVREGDVVLMPQGYHPNVAAPGHPINFLWMMAATREKEDRLFGVVNVHPDFGGGGSGLEKGQAR